jgi:SAM-dependent methyltransferase
VSIEAWRKDRAVLRQYFDDPIPEDMPEDQYWTIYHRGEENTEPEERALFERCLAIKQGGAFLEVGIGYNPNPTRISHMVQNRVAYTGLDLSIVCERHRPMLQTASHQGLAFRLIGNRAGSYLYNLVDLVRAGETFDLIYFDGHHTMYVDAGPMAIAAGLLRPDGIFVVDDIDWSLTKLARDMYVSYRQWHFYRGHYDFDQYEPAQIRECPMQVLVDTLLIAQLGFVIDPTLKCLRKAVLRRGAAT